MDYFIRELTPPDPASDRDAEAWGPLERFAGIVNRGSADTYGEGRLLETSQRVLADWTMPGQVTTRLFLAFPHGARDLEAERTVAAAKLMVSPRDSPSLAYPHVVVDAPHRRRGIGTFVAAHLEDLARADGRTSLQAWVEHPTGGGERVLAPTGHGSVSAADPAARFLWKHGWELGQVERISELRLPVPAGSLRAHVEAAEARAGAAYRVLTWEGESDPEYLDDLARLNGDMSIDAPAGDLEVDEEQWDAERVSQMERRALAAGSTFLNAAVLHVPSGTLVAQSMLQLDLDDTTRPAQQDNTLVTSTHRGRRLGMLVKAANLVQLAERYPECTGVFTWNAEENAHMLRVNEALGFVPLAPEGGWQKRL
ncbi:GNAT family N-acetyltransferase [Pseudoclavibacter sp. VKM Ac-2867]|uniref:GNAT family N-acetyltransferase n=1 Tax=Pseudoclavibacter sp. VKM Ac-2867 TaxID=2783829 RepID=UPI00188B6BEE|nr:GNAT family N-acetyltransferase [Pseudoclavibacter sp. VKM Ac-2867]MBF4459694.1 GNAT family N-acetyltransferase [Pseudoclavibacter sp. VKM Ac-2867]